MDTKALVTIQDIVDDCLLEKDANSETQVIRYTRFAERALKDLHLFHLNDISVAEITVNQDLKMAYLPDDLLRILRVGKRLANGNLYTLTLNEHQETRDGDFSCDPITSTANPDVITSNDSYDNTNYRAQYYVRGGVSELGTYRVNERLHRLEFNINLTITDVIIEYVSSGVKIGGVTYVPEIAREAIIAYISWKSETNPNLREINKQEYFRETTKLDDINRPTLTDMQDALWASNTQVVTR